MTPVAPLALWLVPVPDLGGVARHVLDVVAAHIPGFRLVVLAPTGELTSHIRARGGAVLDGDFGPGAGFARSRRTLMRAVAHLRPAVIHSHLAYADIVAAATPVRRGTMRVSTEHGIAGDAQLYARSKVSARARRQAHRARLRRTDCAIAVSQSTAQLMREAWGAGNVTVIPNGVDTAAFSGTYRRRLGEGIRLLTLSRLAPEKRLDAVLRAMPHILERDPAARLTIGGQGPERGRLTRIVDELGLSRCVHLAGYTDARQAMAHHDMLIQLSAWENASYSLLDARAAQLPVVATRVGGNGEIFHPDDLLDTTGAGEILAAIARGGARPAPGRLSTVGDMTAAIARAYRREAPWT